MRWSPVFAVLALSAYIGAYYWLAPSTSQILASLSKPTWSSITYCRVFYPLRLVLERRTTEYDCSVESVSFEERQILLIAKPDFAYFIPFRARDDEAMRSLKKGEHIRVRVDVFPDLNLCVCHNEFRAYTRFE